MLSDELLDSLASLFDEEQKAALEFMQGTRKLTIQKQIKYYYGYKFPFTPDQEEFLDAFALNIHRHLITICKIAEIQKNCELLANKDSYQDSSVNFYDKERKGKSRGLGNTQRVFEVLAHDKTRGGNSQRSEEYDGVEEYYELKDKKELTTDLQITFQNVNHSKDLKEMKIDSLGRFVSRAGEGLSEVKDIDKKIEEKEKEIEEMPAWTTHQSGMSRHKSRNTGIEGKDFYREQLDNTSSLNMVKKFNTADNVMKMFGTDIADLRSTFWNSFAFLFVDFQCLY